MIIHLGGRGLWKIFMMQIWKQIILPIFYNKEHANMMKIKENNYLVLQNLQCMEKENMQ